MSKCFKINSWRGILFLAVREALQHLEGPNQHGWKEGLGGGGWEGWREGGEGDK